MDLKSLAFGVLLAVIAQGIYDGVLYAFMGQKIEVVAVMTALIVTVVVLFSMFYIFDFFGNSPYVTHRKKEEPKS
jgi:uncharacterized membrane-anchored protein